MFARQAVLLTPPRSSHPTQLLSRQHYAPLNPFLATHTRPPSKCCKQKTYAIPKSFGCNTYKKQGGTFFQPKASLSSRSTPQTFRRSEDSPQCAQSSALFCHSLHQECFTIPLPSTGSALFLKTAAVSPNNSHSGPPHLPRASSGAASAKRTQLGPKEGFMNLPLRLGACGRPARPWFQSCRASRGCA